MGIPFVNFPMCTGEWGRVRMLHPLFYVFFMYITSSLSDNEKFPAAKNVVSSGIRPGSLWVVNPAPYILS